MMAPIIPGLTDCEIPSVLEAARDAGAQGAGFVMLRLPMAVGPVFTSWLKTHRPLAAEKALSLIKEMRGGKLNDATWGRRMRGSGPYAENIAATFDVFTRKLGLDRPWTTLDTSQFRPPRLDTAQKMLFEECD
jgi:DNA repair photolyase